MPTNEGSPLPAVFISHGSPSVALEDDDYTAALGALGRRVPNPRAMVVVSAHWQNRWPIRVTAWRQAAILHDFGGFPAELYALDYPAPGDPELAREVAGLLAGEGLDAVLEPRRGLDHGAWVPLRLAWPAADIPVLQVSLPVPATPERLFQLGRALRPLRTREILIVGSGGVVHNLGLVRFQDESAPVDDWAAAFDQWVEQRLAAGDTDSLLGYRSLAPRPDLAVPTTEHFDPLFCAAGAAFDGERATGIYEGFRYGNLSMRSFLFSAR